MFKKFSSVTATILLTSVVINTGKAEAIVYQFNDFNPGGGSISASGFFDINDTSNTGTVDFPTELVDWEITLTDSTTSEILTPSNSTLSSLLVGYLEGVSVTPTLLDFSTANNGITDSTFSIKSNNALVDEQLLLTRTLVGSTETLAYDGLTSTANIGGPLTLQAAAVPFEFSPSLGLLAVGGFWGFSRLRKRAINKKITEDISS